MSVSGLLSDWDVRLKAATRGGPGKVPANCEAAPVALISMPIMTEVVVDTREDDTVRLSGARAQAFVAKGVPAQQADILASRLMRRDRELDDRRSCAECASFEHGCCLQYRQPFGGGGVEVLHRCAGFKESERRAW